MAIISTGCPPRLKKSWKLPKNMKSRLLRMLPSHLVHISTVKNGTFLYIVSAYE